MDQYTLKTKSVNDVVTISVLNPHYMGLPMVLGFNTISVYVPT